MIAEAILLIVCLAGLADGVAWMARNELARWRARRIVFPPIRTIEVQDSIPF